MLGGGGCDYMCEAKQDCKQIIKFACHTYIYAKCRLSIVNWYIILYYCSGN